MRLAETKYTPGPWFEGTGWIGAGELTKQVRVVARIDNYPYGDTEANAKLIAAAPEMAEALLDCLNMVNGDGCPPDWDKVRTILQKAGLLL